MINNNLYKLLLILILMDIRKYFKPTNNNVLNEKTPLLDKSKFKLNYIKPNKKRTFEIFTDGSTFNNGKKPSYSLEVLVYISIIMNFHILVKH